MKNQNKLSEEELRRSLRAEVQYDTEFFLMHDLHPEHQFSEQFLEKMIPLLQAARRGTVKAAEYIMGWQYYAKQGMAAVLICFLLACAAMPETVLAGYHKLIEVVETIYEEYTEFRYIYENKEEEAFEPLKLNYLPNDLKIIEEKETKNSLNLLYMNEDKIYLKIYQCLVVVEDSTKWGVDTETAKGETIYIHGEDVKLVFKENRVNFVWAHNRYHISGQTNLSKEELTKILNHIEI